MKAPAKKGGAKGQILANHVTFDLTGDPYLDGLLGGVKWGTDTLTYSFPTSSSFYGEHYGFGAVNLDSFGALNSFQQSAATMVLDMVSSVAGISFIQVEETLIQHADIRFGTTGSASTAFAFLPHSMPEGGDIWFGNLDSTYSSPTLGNYAFQTFLHEIGHALGLKHPHEDASMPTDRDSMEYTVMSYRSYSGADFYGYTNEVWGYSQSLMIYDIAALQHMYGANFTTYSGSTTYTWSPTTGEMFVDGVGQGTPGGNRIFQTVWDGGGVDTYDFSSYSTDLKVDLAPGGWTSTSVEQTTVLSWFNTTAAGNIANAFQHNGDPRSLIENAVGGTGNDTIEGNQADNALAGGSGQDTLSGGFGNDTLDGGLGNDTAIFKGSRGEYSIILLADGSFEVMDLRPDTVDGRDVLRSIEYFDFSDRVYTADEFGGAAPEPEVPVTDAPVDPLLPPQPPVTPPEPPVVTPPEPPVTPPVVAPPVAVSTSVSLTLPPDVLGLTAIGKAHVNLTGNSLNNVITGNVGKNRIEGGSGADKIIGGRGADQLFGGSGADTFAFTSIKDSTVKANGRDTVYDFSSRQKDKIDLKAIDASTKVKGNQAFKFIGSQAFHKKAGELRSEKVKGGAYVYGDVNGDGKADFAIMLKGVTKLTKGDFFL